MEDFSSLMCERKIGGGDLVTACFAVYDGHGGKEAAEYAKAHLINTITKSPKFKSGDDRQVVTAIREGYAKLHQVMYEEMWQHWKPKELGQRSIAGTTATLCFVMRGKLYVANVGDSGIVLARDDQQVPTRWQAQRLSKMHRPEYREESARIASAGGAIVKALDMPRPVWSKPTLDENSGQISYTRVSCLNVSRSLGDFWSYNALSGKFIVSPDPDVYVYKLNLTTDRCIILASGGLWENVSPQMAVTTVRCREKANVRPNSTWVNPSKELCQLSWDEGKRQRKRNDNTSVITVIIGHPHSANTGKQPKVEAEKERHWRIKM